MAREFSSRDAKRLIREHRELKAKLFEAKSCPERYRFEISQASDAMVAQEVLKVLRDIPVDEINRDKKGFRVKTLRDYGYTSIADLSAASTSAIASVRGISEDAARSIKRIVNGIVSKARQGVKIRLSADNKTAGAGRLVAAISKYRRSQPQAEVCSRMLDATSRKTDYAMEDLLPASNGLRWFFTSAANRQRAIEAYYLLGSMIVGEYGFEANAALSLLTEIERSTADEAWDDFFENSILFFNILEDISPGVLGTDDAVYGLPEDLARTIQDQCFFPEGLLCELRRYQEWGVKYILHQERVLLGDEMGLGKTIQAIAAMVSLRNTGATHFVVVCPASIIINWCREIRKMSRLSVTKVHGEDRAKALDSWIKSGGVAITTYETTVHFKLDKDFRFDLLVVDEAHYIKNPNARRTINSVLLSRHTQRVLFMTGTALENKVDEMIFLIKVLQPQIAARVRGMEALSSAPQFRKMVAPVYYRRKRADVLTELPDLIESREWCSLLPEEERLYEDAVLSRRYADARRVSWSVDDLSLSSKALRMLEIVNEAEEEGRKTIIFSFFLDTIRKIADLLGDKCLNPITGSVTIQRRQEIIDEFDKAPAGTVLAAQIQTGGTGLNIQSASVIIICEPQFKPSTENQAISRAYRMGQTRNVLVYRLLCENTVDERITAILEKKQAVFNAFADKSAAAAQSVELDRKTFGNIIKEEIDRINAKHGITAEDAKDAADKGAGV